VGRRAERDGARPADVRVPGGDGREAAAGLRGYRERRLAGLFSEVLGVAVTGPDQDFFALGGDDAAAARLLDIVAEDTGVRFPPGTVRQCPTVGALARRLARSRTTRKARVVGYGTELPGTPLFFLISSWQARLIARHYNAIAGRPCYAVQPSGFEGRARVDRRVEARARRALRDIRSVQPHGPYHVAGYSANAYVAFEVARLLEAEGEATEALVIVDMWAPVFSRRRAARLRIEERWETVRRHHPHRGRFLDARRRAAFVKLNVVEGADHLLWRVRGWTAGIVPRRVKVQGTLFHELTVTGLRPYRAKPLDVDLVVVKADDFGGWSWTQRRTEPDLSWHRISRGHIDVVEVSGDHLTILEHEHGPGLAAALATGVELGRLRRTGGPGVAELPVPATGELGAPTAAAG